MITKSFKLDEEIDRDILEYLHQKTSPKVNSSALIKAALRFALHNPTNANEYLVESLPSFAERTIWIILNACASSYPSLVSTKDLYSLVKEKMPDLKGNTSSGEDRLEKTVRWSLFFLKQEALIQKGTQRGTYLFNKEMENLIPLVQSSGDYESFRASMEANFIFRLAVREDSPYSKLMM